MRSPAPRAVLQPPERSLLTAARPAPAGRWENGLTFPSAVCGAVRLWADCTDETVDLIDRAPIQLPDYDPFVIQSWYTCSTGTSDTREQTRQIATDLLETLTPYAVEHELWTGSMARAGELPNRSFVATDDDVADRDLVRATDLTPAASASTGVSPLYAVGALEHALGSYPGRGFIHAALDGAAFLATQTALDGKLLRTKLGSVLVPGAGYPGTGPDGDAAPDGTTWVYGTGPVTVRLGTPEVPDDGMSIDRDTNTLEVRAERIAAATWDGCALFAILMTLKSD